MVLRIFSVLCVVLGSLGFVARVCLDAKDGYYTHVAISIGLVVMGFSGVSMNARQYRGGAATIIASIMTFIALTGIVNQMENYFRYREYIGSTVIFYGMLVLMAIGLFLTGHRVHRMQLVINARLRPSTDDGKS